MQQLQQCYPCLKSLHSGGPFWQLPWIRVQRRDTGELAHTSTICSWRMVAAMGVPELRPSLSETELGVLRAATGAEGSWGRKRLFLVGTVCRQDLKELDALHRGQGEEEQWEWRNLLCCCQLRKGGYTKHCSCRPTECYEVRREDGAGVRLQLCLAQDMQEAAAA